MNKPIKLELGKCYEVRKIDNTKIQFNFWGGEPPYGKLLTNDEEVLLDKLLDKSISCYEIKCP